MSFGLSRGRTLDVTGYGRDTADLPAFDPLAPETARLDPRTWFSDPERRFELEIGSGKGTFLVQQSELAPETNFLGIERAAEFYRYAADRLRRRSVANVRMLRGDAVDFLKLRCPDGLAAVIHLYFSDPWPKARHHKRRVLQDHSLEAIHRVLEPDGELRLVTDHDDLWAWYELHAERHAARFERLPFVAPDPARAGELVGTNYERKFTREGRPFHAMTLRRIGDES